MVASIKIDTREMEKALKDFGTKYQRVVEIAGQSAARKTAYLVIEAEKAEMRRKFDSVTPWTLNAFRVAQGRERVQRGTLRSIAGSEINAEVRVKDGYWYRADDYLNTQIAGGDRKTKAFERALQARGVLPSGWYAVPGEKAERDAYGNMRPSQIRQILSWFGSAEMVAGSTQNMTDATRARRRRGTKTKRGFEYVAIQPNSRRGRLLPGIYRRTFLAFGSSLEPIMIFVRRVAYKPRFDFYGVGRRVVTENFSRLFAAEFQKYKPKTSRA